MKIHMGSIIKRIVQEKKLSAGYLAEQIGLATGSVNRLYSYEFVQTEVLVSICVVLNYDFFAVYSEALNIKKDEVKVVSECEKLLAEKTEEMEAFKKETAKEIEALYV